jgi:hypothetical protein
MSGLNFPWSSGDSEPPPYDDSEDGPEALMWRSVASAASSLGYRQATCPVCVGKGWMWVTHEERYR